MPAAWTVTKISRFWVYALCKRGIMLIEAGANPRSARPSRDSLELAIDSVFITLL